MSVDRKNPPLKTGQVQIWKADLAAWHSRAGSLRAFLSPSEMDRARRLKIKSKQEELLISRGLLRLILSTYLNVEPQQVELTTSSTGKPGLQHQEIGFNVSHSSEQLLLAFSLHPNLGIDVQEIYPISSIKTIIQKLFSPAEQEYLTRRNFDPELFFGLWTAKEAYLKALGVGFQTSGGDWSLLPDPLAPGSFQLHPAQDQDTTWFIREVEVGEGYKASLAVGGNIDQVLIFPLVPGEDRH